MLIALANNNNNNIATVIDANLRRLFWIDQGPELTRHQLKADIFDNSAGKTNVYIIDIAWPVDISHLSGNNIVKVHFQPWERGILSNWFNANPWSPSELMHVGQYLHIQDRGSLLYLCKPRTVFIIYIPLFLWHAKWIYN